MVRTDSSSVTKYDNDEHINDQLVSHYISKERKKKLALNHI